MAFSIIPTDVWEEIEPLLPPRTMSRKGGRPPISNRDVLTGIIFVLRTGIPWDQLPEELGCGCGMTCLRRLRYWREMGIWPAIQRVLDEKLSHSQRINWARLNLRPPDSDGVPCRSNEALLSDRRPRSLQPLAAAPEKMQNTGGIPREGTNG